MVNLNGRVALVTGGGKGIGRGISLALAAAGAAVAVGYATDRSTAEGTVGEIVQNGGRAVALGGDVANPEDVDRLFRRANDALGPVDTLVNNAATYSFQPFEDVTPRDFDRTYRANVLGAFLTCQSFIKQLPSAADGSIVNISTAGISTNAPGSALYTSTKGALTTLTRVLANELGPRNIRVNAVAPGATETDGARNLGLLADDNVARAAALTPLGRLGRPDDIGPAVAFLASPAAAWITGDVIFASGGMR